MWPVVVSCSYLNEAGFKYYLNLSPKVLNDSPVCSSHCFLFQLCQYMAPLCHSVLAFR